MIISIMHKFLDESPMVLDKWIFLMRFTLLKTV